MNIIPQVTSLSKSERKNGKMGELVKNRYSFQYATIPYELF